MLWEQPRRERFNRASCLQSRLHPGSLETTRPVRPPHGLQAPVDALHLTASAAGPRPSCRASPGSPSPGEDRHRELSSGKGLLLTLTPGLAHAPEGVGTGCASYKSK